VVPQRVDLSREWSAVRADWWAIDWFDKKTGSRRAGAAIAGLTLAFALSAALGLRRRLRDLDRARASDGAAASPPPSAP
jgi:hypothetical protein